MQDRHAKHKLHAKSTDIYIHIKYTYRQTYVEIVAKKSAS